MKVLNYARINFVNREAATNIINFFRLISNILVITLWFIHQIRRIQKHVYKLNISRI